ncbi:MAG: amidohydrolase [Dysgonamonadaceae bacterium]|jgi:hippurate hydrolase|nr:amidohydrolase [Dysgonamonadaceae bacterium]
MTLKQLISQQTEAIFPGVVSHYYYLHQHPELSYQEENTAQYIADFLEKEGIPYRQNIGGYGILAWVKGEKLNNGKTIALVADMDALPIQEENDIPYKSQNDGVMHACGHDAQAASLMGVAKIIHNLRSEFSGTVLFVFQPGEEKSPGGADLMLKDGVFRDFTPDFVIKQHAYIDLPTGKIGFHFGTITASADEVHIVVKGQGGHGAIPHTLNDTVLTASNIIVAMQQLVSRVRNPFNPMVLSFGKFIANGATNVIPSEVVLAGSMRCMDEEERQKMLQLIPVIAHSTTTAYGCTCEVNLPEGYPSVFCDEQITEIIRRQAIDFLGENNVGEFPKRMTADDFGFFSQQYPCCYYRFGIAKEGQKVGALHTGTFLIDEKSLQTSTGFLAFLTIDAMKQ